MRVKSRKPLAEIFDHFALRHGLEIGAVPTML
jgi:hypothetical protein